LTTLKKPILIKYTDILILFFLSVHVITSQLSVAVSSIGLGGLIILIAFRLILSRYIPYNDKTLMFLFLLLVLSFLVSGLFSEDPPESISNARRVFLFVTFFATFIFVKNLNELKIILTCFFLFTVLISVTEIIRYFMDTKTLTGTDLIEFRINYFGYPITNGEIKMLILLLIASFIITKQKFVLNKLWLSAIAAVVLISLYFTNTRNAFLGLFAGLIYLGFVKNKIFLAGMLIFVAAFLVFAPYSAKERILSIADIHHPSNENRITIWKTGIKIFKDYPILGTGEIDFAKIYARYKPIEHHGEGSHMHNNTFHILISFGIVGLISWLVLMVYIFVRQIRIYYLTKSDKILNNLVTASIASMIAFQVSGLTEWNFGDFEFAAVLWFSLGLAFLCQKLYNQQTVQN
jgi:putative inorganic carbon (HCO3(-)) transporter